MKLIDWFEQLFTATKKPAQAAADAADREMQRAREAVARLDQSRACTISESMRTGPFGAAVRSLNSDLQKALLPKE